VAALEKSPDLGNSPPDPKAFMYIESAATLVVWRDRVCAVEVHDRQGDRVGRTSVRAWETVQAVGTQTKSKKTLKLIAQVRRSP
jgi:hypothetical protein